MQASALQERPRFGATPDGTIEGYASLFGVADQANDMVMPGAFTASLKGRGPRRVPMLFQHDPAEPIGVWLDLHEDFRGLFVRGRLIPDVARAREVLALIRQGALDGLSIGFRTVKGRIDPRTRVRRLDAIDLWEISVVTFPLLAGARVAAVKGLSFSWPREVWPREVCPREAREVIAAPRPSPARARAESAWRGITVTRSADRRIAGAMPHA